MQEVLQHKAIIWRHATLFTAVILSIMLHGVVAYLFILPFSSVKVLGAGGNQLGVEQNNGLAIESIVEVVAMPTGEAEIIPKEGGNNPDEQVAIAAADTAAHEATQDSLLDKNEEIGDVVASNDREIEKKPEEHIKTDNDEGQDNVHQNAQEELTSGGITSRGFNEAPPTKASEGASAGEVSRYATSVYAIVLRNHPRHDGRRGNLKIQFVIGQNGEVASASINTSSGNANLDQKAIIALRTMRFSPPPPGLTEAQRTYLTTFNFR